MLALAVVFALLQLANVTGRASPDSKNYLSYALGLGGADKRTAAAVTIDFACESRAASAKRRQSVDVIRFHRADPRGEVMAQCRAREWHTVESRLRAGQTGGHTVPFLSERFMRIFEARPGYPAFLVPFVALLGATWGLWAAGVAVTAAGGVLAFLILRTLGSPTRVCLTGQVLYYVLPCGTTSMRPMAEGLTLTLTLAAVWGCVLALEGRRLRAGGWLVGGALAALFTVKHSQALFLGVCLAGAGVVIALRERREALRGGLEGRAGREGRGAEAVVAAGRRGQGAVTIAVIGVCGAAGTLFLAGLLGYPSATESVQDLLTRHFQRPDRVRPWPEFWQLQTNFWPEWLRRQVWEPLFAAALATGAWGLVRGRCPAFAAVVCAAASTGFLTQAGHPDIDIWGGRLIVIAWLLPVLGVPLLLEALSRSPVTPPLREEWDGQEERADRAHSMR
ncbi:hypothetical protein [Streptomyces sp. NPDC002328]|uniref:hypothetical protein n=1 Tax=Streptomyces sp. NPDC002328 TaxID=3364642 RepID=UPI0036CB4ED8